MTIATAAAPRTIHVSAWERRDGSLSGTELTKRRGGSGTPGASVVGSDSMMGGM